MIKKEKIKKSFGHACPKVIIKNIQKEQKMNDIKEKYLEEYKNYEINKFKEEFGIVDEGEIVSEEDLEGEKDG